MQEKILRPLVVVALAVWLGGLVALGALVAPIVFGVVPAPSSADAMTLVFRRFDRVALVCSAIVAGAEVLRARASVTLTRLDLARSASAFVAALLAVGEAGWVSPKIAALHQAGAIRGLGALGAELERTHHLAELLAKTELAALLVFAALLAWTPFMSSRHAATSTRPADAPDATPPDPSSARR